MIGSYSIADDKVVLIGMRITFIEGLSEMGEGS